MNERPIEELMAETIATSVPQIRNGRPDVFAHLVESDDDLVGIVAYSIYKREKRDWLARWEATRGELPTEGEVEAFVLANLTEGQKERYRVAADSLLEGQGGHTLIQSHPYGGGSHAEAVEVEDEDEAQHNLFEREGDLEDDDPVPESHALAERFDHRVLAPSPVIHSDVAFARRIEELAVRVEAASARRCGGFFSHVVAGAAGAVVLMMVAAGISYLPTIGVALPPWVPFATP